MMSMVGNMKDELLFYQRILKFDKTFALIHDKNGFEVIYHGFL